MLFRKMLRDMRLNKTQFISIFIMTLLGIFIYSGVSSEWYGLKSISNQFYQETNLADAWVYGSGFSKEAVKSVAEMDGITGVERRLTVEGIGDFKNKPVINLHFIEDGKISKLKLIRGEKFSVDKDGIWLDSLFAKAKGLNVGDLMKITVNGKTISEQIKGLVMSPEYVYFAGENDIVPNHANTGYAFLSYHSFPKEIPMTFTQLMVTAKNKSDQELEKIIDKALDGKYSVFLERKNLRSYMQFSEEIKEHRAISRIFPIAFLAVALLTTVTTMARLVNNQRTQIGILKAVGFKKRRILFHYISFGFWISLSGAVLGTVLGVMILPYMFYSPMKTAYTLPAWEPKTPVSVFVIAFLSVIACTLATYLTCRNVLKDTPSESLRPKAPRSVKHSLLDRSRLWSRLSFRSQWNLRDVLRCKGRSVMAIAGIIGCSALLICAFSMKDTLNYVIKWNYTILNRYESILKLNDDIKPEQVQHIKNAYGGEELLEGSVEIKANGKKQSGELMVTDNHIKLIHFVDDDCKEIKLPKNQVCISSKMAKQLDVGVGDQIQWHNYGEEKWNISRIGSIYRTPFIQGITMSEDKYEEYGYTFIPTKIISGKDLTKKFNELKTEGIAKVLTRKNLINSNESMIEAMNTIIFVLMLAAVFLAVVVIYNLGVLSFTERHRELSTLKVIGFKTGKLRSLLLTQNIWLTAVGIIPGIPAGIWMVSCVFQFAGKVLDFYIVISPLSYLYTIIGTMLVSVCVNRLFSKRLKEIDMVSSLKGVE